MLRTWVVIAACFVLTAAATPAQNANITYLNLQPHANQKLAENFHDGREGNNLAELPTGEQTFAGKKFKIEEGLIQLRGNILPDKPEKVEGIEVGQTCAKLHILHATGYGGGPNKEGNPLYVADDTLIGQYTIRYEDKSVEVIEIVYGKDVRDWWFTEEEKAVTRGKVAWEGDNDLAKQFNVRVRLYLATWENPKPDKKVVSIDYLSTSETAAAPFCVAITVEGK